MTDRYGKPWTDEVVAAGTVSLSGRGAGVVTRSWVEAPPFLTTLHGPMRELDGAPVHHGWRCKVCEWAYAGSETPLPSVESVSYGYGSPDVLEVLDSAQNHAGSTSHFDALAFARKKGPRWARLTTSTDK